MGCFLDGCDDTLLLLSHAYRICGWDYGVTEGFRFSNLELCIMLVAIRVRVCRSAYYYGNLIPSLCTNLHDAVSLDRSGREHVLETGMVCDGCPTPMRSKHSSFIVLPPQPFEAD